MDCCTGVRKIWPQCAAQALLLSFMLRRHHDVQRFVPVFGGDLNEHIIVHGEEDTWHVAASQTSSEAAIQAGYNQTSVACMRALIRRSRHEIDISGEQGACTHNFARLAVRNSELLILEASLCCCCNALKSVEMAEACAMRTPF